MRSPPPSLVVPALVGNAAPSKARATASQNAGSSALPRRLTTERPSRQPASRLRVTGALDAEGGRAPDSVLRWRTSSILTLRFRVEENRIGNGGGDGAPALHGNMHAFAHALGAALD